MHAVVCFDWLSCAKSDAHSEFCFMMMMMMAYCRCLAALSRPESHCHLRHPHQESVKRLLNALALYCWLECWLFCPKAPTRTFHSAHVAVAPSESKSSFVPSSPPPLPTPYTLQDSPTTKPTLPSRARNQTTAFGLPAAVWFDLCTLVSKPPPDSHGRFRGKICCGQVALLGCDTITKT